MRAELEVSPRCDVILQMAAAGQSNRRRFTIFFIFKIVKSVSWMSWCWQTLTTRTSASSAADGCYCCRMTWRQYCPTVQLRAFFFAVWSKFLYLLLAPTARLSPYFLLNTSHLHPSPRWTMGHRYTKRMRAADKGKLGCYAACTPPRWPPALHTTSTSWLDGVNSRQNPQIGFLNHLLAGVITASKWYALSQVRKEAAHHPHALNVQFIYIKKTMLLMLTSFCGGTN